MSRFWLRPRWLVGHVLVVTTVVVFVSLGFWQLDRLEQRLAYNALLAERGAAPAAPVDELLERGADMAAYRRATVRGVYEPDGEVLLSTRSHAGRAGHHVLTPLRAEDGTLVVVDRGWVPMAEQDPPVARAAPPEGTVTVTGLLLPAAEADRAGRFDGGQGRLQFVSAPDLDRITQALGAPVAPLYLLAASQEPAAGSLPILGEPPVLEEGNHRSYAVQWFLFATVVALGYPLLLRRTAAEQRSAEAPAPSVPVGS